MNTKKRMDSDYQNHINGLENKKVSFDQDHLSKKYNVNAFDDYDNFPENIERKKRIRILLGFLMLVLISLGGYFYWVSRELDRIQEPGILIMTPKNSSMLPEYLEKYLVVMLYKKILKQDYSVSRFLKKEQLIKYLKEINKNANVVIN